MIFLLIKDTPDDYHSSFYHVINCLIRNANQCPLCKMENTKINACPVMYGLDSDFFPSVAVSN